jgi:hypothetical protein
LNISKQVFGLYELLKQIHKLYHRNRLQILYHWRTKTTITIFFIKNHTYSRGYRAHFTLDIQLRFGLRALFHKHRSGSVAPGKCQRIAGGLWSLFGSGSGGWVSSRIAVLIKRWLWSGEGGRDTAWKTKENKKEDVVRVFVIHATECLMEVQ